MLETHYAPSFTVCSATFIRYLSFFAVHFDQVCSYFVYNWCEFECWSGDDDDDDEDDYLERFFDDILGEDDDDDEEEDSDLGASSTGLVQQQQPQPVQQTAQVASTNAVEETPVGGTDYPGITNDNWSKLLAINEYIEKRVMKNPHSLTVLKEKLKLDLRIVRRFHFITVIFFVQMAFSPYCILSPLANFIIIKTIFKCTKQIIVFIDGFNA